MESRHPDLDQVRAILGRPARFEDLPPLEIPPPPRPWSSAGVTKRAAPGWAMPLLLVLTASLAPLLVLLAIGAWAVMP